jgi:hypothetical protein
MSRQAPFKGLFVSRLICSPPRRSQPVRGIVRSRMKIIKHKARDIKSGETVLDRGTWFIIKEVRVSAEHGPIAFIDMESVWHGVYHPDEYLGVWEQSNQIGSLSEKNTQRSDN